ncbi:hypothetical protein LTR99_006255 [Exophiala xenobiotica]|uniref:Uncharacterized protein n=1 Tax=Vermiconidia calcicola TaxID=1690605 RepID=A0AAV9QA35_9PEZI|nr:hypothetical protein H2202_009564 [Exophiala xenobiotica]KAK5534194.1 hypothetical protein LTR23_008865 [Chaetothyriales sp. CCFEE 6169]KAK5537425.1 hypothetical protein LTR25_004677 [Vermiconidia calcicola]KAK5189752.1 hypothetical protein LTR92_010212 [Exophiala xenobiotica]KAK5206233.1 hypothetical protein LTR41_008103 [Exophiala xenobiotica]
MSKESWAITSTKRKAKSATPAPRKRSRLNDVENDADKRTRSQQTLTQAQWVTSVLTSFNEDDMLQTIPRPRTASTRRSLPGLKKRNSTLTQMDFFSFPPPDHDDFEDAMLPTTEEEVQRPTVPQYDGTYESPRRPRRRKATSPGTGRSTRRKITTPNPESQEYRPSTRRRKAGSTEAGSVETLRRSSGRIASSKKVISDPAENLQYLEEALERGPAGKPPWPLEIKESVDEGEEIMPEQTVEGESRLLQTPKKARSIILSSQSPESLAPSTRRSRKLPSTPVRSLRTPLAERSVNVPVETPSKKSASRLRRSPKHSPKKSKVVVLKPAKRKQGRKISRIEDSQINIYSIPSSSPQVQQGPKVKKPSGQATAAGERPANEAEIPGTSQVQGLQSSPPAATQESLPSLQDIVSGGRSAARDAGDERSRDPLPAVPQPGDESPVFVRDFAAQPLETTIIAGDDSDHVAEEKSNKTVSPAGDILSREDVRAAADEVDFGSPIANDTQFNVDVEHRVSSPTPHAIETPGKGEKTVNAITLSSSSPTPGSRRNIHTVDTQTERQDEDEPPQTPMPVPRLVESPTMRTHEVDMDLGDDGDEVALPKPGLLHRSSTHVSTTKVPLNDTLQQSSSSPMLSAKITTQKSIHPASIPRPSQMSTQEATQAFANMSSYPQRADAEITQRITIKESSSYPVPISQLPQYTGRSQSQYHVDLGLHEVFDSEDEEDLDLDPPSLPPRPEKTSFDDRELATPRRSRNSGAPDITRATGGDDDDASNSPNQHMSQSHSQARDIDATDSPLQSSQAVSIPSSPNPPALQRQYSPIPGFNNDTQSNFTQNGHVTAAYIHRQREAGVMPTWYVPQPYQVPGYTRRR